VTWTPLSGDGYGNRNWIPVSHRYRASQNATAGVTNANFASSFNVGVSFDSDWWIRGNLVGGSSGHLHLHSALRVCTGTSHHVDAGFRTSSGGCLPLVAFAKYNH